MGIDTAEYSDDFENYDIKTTEGSFPVTTIDHVDGTKTDGKDTLEDIEWAYLSRPKRIVRNIKRNKMAQESRTSSPNKSLKQ